MKRILIALSMIVMSGFLFATQALAVGIEQRQARQQQRIHNGISKGELTRHEADRLLQEQRQIQKYKTNAYRDGRLSRAEIRHLNDQLDAADRHINQLIQNDNRSRLHVISHAGRIH